MLRSIVVVAIALAGCVPAVAQRYHLGKAPPKELVEAWDIDVRPDGAGLPLGKGSVAEGRQVYTRACAACHGDKGEGIKPEGFETGYDRLVGGAGTLRDAKPVLTVGSFWPYSTTLYDYVRRAMPFNAPQSLSTNEVYAVTAYVLHMNGILPESATLDAASLPQVKMPNRDGFVTEDPRPDVKGK